MNEWSYSFTPSYAFIACNFNFAIKRGRRFTVCGEK
jgi:hypothetical protein